MVSHNDINVVTQSSSSSQLPKSPYPIFNRSSTLIPLAGGEKDFTSHLTCFKQAMSVRNFFERVFKVLSTLWRKSMERHYQSCWKYFPSWCSERSQNLIYCPIETVSEFLAHLFYDKLLNTVLLMYTGVVYQ